MFHSLANWFGFGDRSERHARPFPREWHDHLRRHVWQYSHLRDDARLRVEDVVTEMVARRRWTGGSGFELTDEMRVVIAGQAALMTIGLDDAYYFHRVPDIIIYPKPFFVSREQGSLWSTDPVFGTAVDSPRLGEAWHRGPIVLSWDQIVHPFDDEGYHLNVVIHEFTHHLDGLDGDVSGTPPMTDLELERDWYRVTELDYLELAGRADRDEPTLLSHYGATNRAEFFAVATECFFDFPHDLREQHAHLYHVLAKYFRQSPADYLPRAAQPPRHRSIQATRPARRRKTISSPRSADPFSQGLAEYHDGEFDAAIDCFSAAIDQDPDDSEAYAARALAYFGLDELEAALADADQALQLDPEDYEALTVRGSVLVATGELSAGIADLREASQHSDSAQARAYLGFAFLQQGASKRAVHELSLAIAADPYDAQSYLWRAEAYRQLGNPDNADRDRQRAARLEPNE